MSDKKLQDEVVYNDELDNDVEDILRYMGDEDEGQEVDTSSDFYKEVYGDVTNTVDTPASYTIEEEDMLVESDGTESTYMDEADIGTEIDDNYEDEDDFEIEDEPESYTGDDMYDEDELYEGNEIIDESETYEDADIEGIEYVEDEDEVYDITEIEYEDEYGNPVDSEGNLLNQVEDSIVSASIYQDVDFRLTNNDGEDIPSRVTGNITVEILPIKEIKVPKRVRSDKQDTLSLQESIRKFGQLEPIHVVKYGDYYVLLDGYLRIQALNAIGKGEITAIVDTTISPELAKYYSVVVNTSTPYKFSELMEYVKFVQETQPTLGIQAIESILSMPPGDLLKALYVNTMKVDYPEPYQQLELGKLTIEQAFKRVEKEIQKAEKESTEGVDALNSGELDDQLRNKDELAEMANDAGTQDLDKRRILDPVIRRAVEGRAHTQCEACGFGSDAPEFNGALKAHHIVAVMYGGSDNTSNLILLCNNCHEMVHDYEKGKFLPSEHTYNEYAWVPRVVVLGNILQKLRVESLNILRKKHENTARLVDRGKMGLGKAIKKHDIYLKGEERYGGSPYQTFKEVTKSLHLGGQVDGELGVVSDGDEPEAESTE